MCGIAGYMRIDGAPFYYDQNLAETFHKSMYHRGPDGHGVWFSNRHEAVLVHRRLAIVDLSPAGAQPMLDADQIVVISFNGEIYNHKKIRAELELLGYRFVSHSDTEVFVYAFKAWGIACLDRFEGMFAAAIGDLVKNEWYFVRDRMGVKPLYFSFQGGYLSFASEIKALWTLPWMQKKHNNLATYHYLTYMVTPAPYTVFEGVYKLPAGHYMKFDAQKNYSFTQWYSFLSPSTVYDKKDLANETFCVQEIRKLLRNAVEKRMMSDVPFGVFLSGGIDSSLNVALMSEFTDKVKTFNVAFSDGPEYSEVDWARKIAKQFNTEHHEITISEKEAFEFFPSMVYHQDEPIADCVCIPLYYVSKLLKESGVTVVQVGEGSDELYCGYQNYVNYLTTYNNYYQPARLIPQPLKRAGAWTAAQLFPQKKYHLELLEQWASGRHLFWTGALVFGESSKKEFFKQSQEVLHDPVVEKIMPGFSQVYDSYEVVSYHLKKLYKQKPDADFLLSMIYLELTQRLPELLLMRVDKMTMATSVEGRVPFLDHHHVEFALQIPTALKYKDGQTKYILKKACEGIIPDDVIYRKKVGFAAPTARWFKQPGQFSGALDGIFTNQKACAHSVDAAWLQKLAAKNKSSSYDQSVQLWVLQNLLALEQ